MSAKKRKGNLLVSTAVFVFLTVLVASVLTQVSAKRNAAQMKAMNAGNTSTLLAAADLCADVFVADLRSHVQDVIIADGGYVGNLGDPAAVFVREYEIFEECLFAFERDMKGERGNGTTWIYKVSDPKECVRYTGILDSDVKAYLNSVLETATVRIVVSNDFSLNVSSDDSLTMNNGDVLDLNDVSFTVTLDSGLTHIVQNYSLRGERLAADFDSVYATISVLGTGKMVIESQSISTGRVVKS